MQIYREIPRNCPSALTLGTFDGVHLGHQALIKHLLAIDPNAGLITFENHPLEVLQPHPIKTLSTLEQKLSLFQKLKIKTVILLPFTKALSQLSAEAFLRQFFPFSHLLLGHDAKLGNSGQGDQQEIFRLAKAFPFTAEYLAPFKFEQKTVSSSQIRRHIENGRLLEASHLLGRPYTLSGTVVYGKQKGRLLGFPTANIPLSGLALPPFGVYGVIASLKGRKLPGIANLGVAPTLQERKIPLLEVHLLDFEEDLYNQEIEVELKNFLRPEKKFASIEELKEQIAQDLQKMPCPCPKSN